MTTEEPNYRQSYLRSSALQTIGDQIPEPVPDSEEIAEAMESPGEEASSDQARTTPRSSRAGSQRNSAKPPGSPGSQRTSIQSGASKRNSVKQPVSQRNSAQPPVSQRNSAQSSVPQRNSLQPVSQRNSAQPSVRNSEQPPVSPRHSVQLPVGQQRNSVQSQVPQRNSVQLPIGQEQNSTQPQSQRSSTQPQPQRTSQKSAKHSATPGDTKSPRSSILRRSTGAQTTPVPKRATLRDIENESVNVVQEPVQPPAPTEGQNSGEYFQFADATNTDQAPTPVQPQTEMLDVPQTHTVQASTLSAVQKYKDEGVGTEERPGTTMSNESKNYTIVGQSSLGGSPKISQPRLTQLRSVYSNSGGRVSPENRVQSRTILQNEGMSQTGTSSPPRTLGENRQKMSNSTQGTRDGRMSETSVRQQPRAHPVASPEMVLTSRGSQDMTDGDCCSRNVLKSILKNRQSLIRKQTSVIVRQGDEIVDERVLFDNWSGEQHCPCPEGNKQAGGQMKGHQNRISSNGVHPGQLQSPLGNMYNNQSHPNSMRSSINGTKGNLHGPTQRGIIAVEPDGDTFARQRIQSIKQQMCGMQKPIVSPMMSPPHSNYTGQQPTCDVVIQNGYRVSGYVQNNGIANNYVQNNDGFIHNNDGYVQNNGMMMGGYVQKDCIANGYVQNSDNIDNGYVQNDCMVGGYVQNNDMVGGYVQNNDITNGYVQNNDDIAANGYVQNNGMVGGYVQNGNMVDGYIQNNDDMIGDFIQDDGLVGDHVESNDMSFGYTQSSDMEGSGFTVPESAKKYNRFSNTGQVIAKQKRSFVTAQNQSNLITNAMKGCPLSTGNCAKALKECISVQIDMPLPDKVITPEEISHRESMIQQQRNVIAEDFLTESLMKCQMASQNPLLAEAFRECLTEGIKSPPSSVSPTDSYRPPKPGVGVQLNNYDPYPGEQQQSEFYPQQQGMYSRQQSQQSVYSQQQHQQNMYPQYQQQYNNNINGNLNEESTNQGPLESIIQKPADHQSIQDAPLIKYRIEATPRLTTHRKRPKVKSPHFPKVLESLCDLNSVISKTMDDGESIPIFNMRPGEKALRSSSCQQNNNTDQISSQLAQIHRIHTTDLTRCKKDID